MGYRALKYVPDILAKRRQGRGRQTDTYTRTHTHFVRQRGKNTRVKTAGQKKKNNRSRKKYIIIFFLSRRKSAKGLTILSCHFRNKGVGGNYTLE